jgi:hypothetical protein
MFYIGTAHIDLSEGDYLYLNDHVPVIPRAAYFDPTRDSFNILDDLTYRKASDIVEIFRALFPAGENTLTKETGLEAIAEALEQKPTSLATMLTKPGKGATTGEVWAYGKVQRLMRSPVLRQVLCSAQPNLPTVKAKTLLARINRAEIGEFDALAVGLFLITQWKATVVIPDLGFYGRDMHTSLLREDRLIGGIRFLDDLPDRLRREIERNSEKVARGVVYDDAVLLARHKGMIPGTIEFNEEVARMMESPPDPPKVKLWKPKPLKAKKVQQRKPRTFKRSDRDPY